jgi:hypothetical protein
MKKIVFLIIFVFSLFSLFACGEQTPIIIIKLNPSLDTIEVGTQYIDYGAKANYGLIDLEVIVLETNIDVQTVGVYHIIYEATYNNITKTIKRIVTVIDETPPVLKLNPGIDTILLGEIWIDEGVEVFDNSNNEVIINIFGEVLNEIGEYIITYEAIDQSLNKSYIIRYVHVVENND